MRKEFDFDGDGEITKEEFFQGMRQLADQEMKKELNNGIAEAREQNDSFGTEEEEESKGQWVINVHSEMPQIQEKKKRETLADSSSKKRY